MSSSPSIIVIAYYANLRDELKEALSDLEKQELHKKEEDWFNKTFEQRTLS